MDLISCENVSCFKLLKCTVFTSKSMKTWGRNIPNVSSNRAKKKLRGTTLARRLQIGWPLKAMLWFSVAPQFKKNWIFFHWKLSLLNTLRPLLSACKMTPVEKKKTKFSFLEGFRPIMVSDMWVLSIDNVHTLSWNWVAYNYSNNSKRIQPGKVHPNVRRYGQKYEHGMIMPLKVGIISEELQKEASKTSFGTYMTCSTINVLLLQHST